MELRHSTAKSDHIVSAILHGRVHIQFFNIFGDCFFDLWNKTIFFVTYKFYLNLTHVRNN